MSTLSDFRHFIRRHQLLSDGACVVVGVSGGPDSLALLHSLNKLAPEHRWRLHVAYLHHGLRPEADDEARFVAEVATAWNLGCTIERADVLALAQQPGVSVEEAARQARYAFLGRVALRLGAQYVAVGHNADDQAETLLMHLLRGSGLAGLRGMSPRTALAGLRLLALEPEKRPDMGDVQLVRPLLETPRSEIEGYCLANGLTPRQDATNTDQTFFRNQLRHQVMPILTEINPRLTAILGRTTAVLQGDYDVLQTHRQHLWDNLVQQESDFVRINLAGFRQLPPGDQRAILRQGIGALRSDLRNISWEHSERLLDILASDPQRISGGPYPLVAGLEAWLHQQWIDIRSVDLAIADQPQIYQPNILLLPGQLDLGPNWRLDSQLRTWPRSTPAPWTVEADPAVIWLPKAVPQPLLVRSRQAGDRIYPLGLGGGKDVNVLMTDLKLPRAARPQWPLLIDAEGEILWLVGRRCSEACRLSDDATTAWQIRLEVSP